MRWSDDAPSKGDILRVKTKFFYHYGIFIDEEHVVQFGLPDNGDTPADEICIMVSDISLFSNGEFVEKGICDTPEEKKKHRKPDEIVSIALSRVGETGYNILHNNCEHFVNSCAFGEKRSLIDDVRIKIRKQFNLTE